ncbi:hypothetical protein [Muricoccus radiodurans]|uniref:hypothetical protein n=1 Tax=Muricoccus radiodurans TaxID=2231721 RepID=UPI003CEC71FE
MMSAMHGVEIASIRPPVTAGRLDAVPVWYILKGQEHAVLVSPGRDRWDVVAEAVGQQLRATGRAEDPPSYDTGTRQWALTVTLKGRWGREQDVMVPVRWR